MDKNTFEVRVYHLTFIPLARIEFFRQVVLNLLYLHLKVVSVKCSLFFVFEIKVVLTKT